MVGPNLKLERHFVKNMTMQFKPELGSLCVVMCDADIDGSDI